MDYKGNRHNQQNSRKGEPTGTGTALQDACEAWLEVNQWANTPNHLPAVTMMMRAARTSDEYPDLASAISEARRCYAELQKAAPVKETVVDPLEAMLRAV